MGRTMVVVGAKASNLNVLVTRFSTFPVLSVERRSTV